jgi:integrase/recombinase XerD
MRQHNAENERIKRQYLIFLKEAKRQNQASIDAVAMAINRFEEYTRVKNFKAFHFEQAVGFNICLSRRTRKPASL